MDQLDRLKGRALVFPPILIVSGLCNRDSIDGSLQRVGGSALKNPQPSEYTHNNTQKYIAAYLLLVQAGNEAPSASDVTKVLESVGIDVEEDKLSKLISELEGKNIEELIAEGNEKLSSVPTGGAAAASSGPADAASGEAAAEEEEAGEESEEDDDMGFGLFD
ncbi:60S ribosomal protein P2-beta [Komagataella phaffii CBS 7435]|uniref:60S ribosomal protein P2-beta n=1 Tax=Komagataella phaffii (strain ATCC 76273 / CBS 7435 / CECT 11047 / NRRL Y-11430 / Wegner 21-1) TaxID=981350 RepID=F2QPT4_KOMPC|nr:Putative 60S ribosomal protein [Komagataella phaffii CBS 7435]CCA37412.1 60S ribosomal protein P2-beta [Komagataella phaffii CBS 7435]